MRVRNGWEMSAKVADQVGRISREMAKDFIEHVMQEQVQDVENCAYYDTWDDFFEMELTEEEGDFIFDVDRTVKNVEVRVKW